VALHAAGSEAQALWAVAGVASAAGLWVVLGRYKNDGFPARLRHRGVLVVIADSAARAWPACRAPPGALPGNHALDQRNGLEAVAVTGQERAEGRHGAGNLPGRLFVVHSQPGSLLAKGKELELAA